MSDAAEDFRRDRSARGVGAAVSLAVVAIGVSDILTQLVLMRELLTVFAGNELVFGVILGGWLALMGAGAYLVESETATDGLGVIVSGYDSYDSYAYTGGMGTRQDIYYTFR